MVCATAAITFSTSVSFSCYFFIIFSVCGASCECQTHMKIVFRLFYAGRLTHYCLFAVGYGLCVQIVASNATNPSPLYSNYSIMTQHTLENMFIILFDKCGRQKCECLSLPVVMWDVPECDYRTHIHPTAAEKSFRKLFWKLHEIKIPFDWCNKDRKSMQLPIEANSKISW